jgi:hypothetical protein
MARMRVGGGNSRLRTAEETVSILPAVGSQQGRPSAGYCSREGVPAGQAGNGGVAAADLAPEVELKTCTVPGGRFAIVVRDRGVGIQPADLARVFEPYFTTRRAGTGLGLAIARNIVEGLGGRIDISSQPGIGTEIRIELPVREVS